MALDRNHTFMKALRALLVAAMMQTSVSALAQVQVHGSVFGGGNNADVKTNTNVNISYGTVDNNVYGGGNLGFVGEFTSAENPTTGSKEYTWTNGGTCNITISGGTVGPANNTDTKKGNVFGAGKGVANTYECEPAMVYKTDVSITKGTINGNVYGGGEVGRVENNTEVTIGPETGDDVADVKGSVFGAGAGLATHGYSALVRGNSTVLVQGKAKVGGSVYGGGETASVGRFVVNPTTSLPTTPYSGGTCTVTVKGQAAVTGNVYGACKGVEPEYTSGAVHWVSGDIPQPFANEAEYLAFLPTLALTSNTIVTIGGSATVGASVYGGGQRGIALGYVEVDMTGGNVANDVYGGGALANTNTANWDGSALTKTYYEITGLTTTSPVTGLYTRSGSSEPYTYTPTTDATAQTGTKYYRLTDTQVNLTGGAVGGDVYGGGLGYNDADDTKDIEAIVYGDVKVELNKNNGTCEVNGSVFGCNNEKGTPKGDVVVNVYGTSVHKADGTQQAKPTKFADYTNVIDTDTDDETDDLAHHTFELAGVYGGGNLAAYAPATGKGSTVNIYGCDKSSIKEVYGGGSAADVPGTTVNVYGSYEIGFVYAGGNGTSSAANVNGDATTTIHGGTIYRAFAGSNTAGDITGMSTLNISELTNTDANYCVLKIGDVFSYGNLATMTGTSVLNLGCLDNKIGALYGGAMNANIGSADSPRNIVLNINGGKYHQVFGGNKSGGIINGSIKVNIEKTTDCTLEIDELYGCGNAAAYTTANSTSTPYADPEINIISCTSIGAVYGGGWGSDAVVTGNPKVNINMLLGTGQTTETGMGTIGNVYGGGYGADVVGNTTVNIGTTSTVTLPSNSSSATVLGANITGSIYGGGEGAGTTVTGDVAVNIGGEESGSYVGGTIAIGGSVYGGSALGAVNATRNGTTLVGSTKEITDPDDNTKTKTVPTETKVTLKKGTITEAVYGGGMGKLPTSSTSNDGETAKVYGDATVTLYGDVVAGGIYGGCNLNGTMYGKAQLDLLGGRVGTAFTATTTPTEIPNIVFGGGLGALTSVEGDVTVNVGSATGGSTIYSNVYGGSKNGSVAKTSVNLLGGVIWGDVFGGGYETASNATAATDVAVTLNGTAFAITYDSYEETVGSNTETVQVPKTGRIFGCNNLQGSPTGNVTVNVEKTTDLDADHAKTASGKLTSTTASDHYYNVQAVYGGGNLAPYNPTVSGAKSQVNISGCNDTSIEYVYGGGNAAAMGTTTNTVGSNVNIEGAYEIGYTFGGGNGSDKIKNVSGNTVTWTANPGANVYGNATSTLVGGFIHNVFGGSNTLGTITGEAKIDIDEASSSCDLITENIYGAGMNADVEGNVNLRIGCLADNVKNVYGGAMAAKINGDVTLTITSGILDNVYGGNNESGSISGKITVNIEEVDACKPIIIGNLYGGGNLAAYPGPYFTNNNPNIEVNVKSFTSIGNVYGGGRGESAIVTGNTEVNINEVKGRWAGTARAAETLTINGVQVSIPEHKANEIGAIGNVYGGGDLAKVVGNTTVNIGTKEYEYEIYNNIKVGETDVTGYYTCSETGVYTKVEPEAPATTVLAQANTIYYKAVEGAKITGNVYGGGKKADVGQYDVANDNVDVVGNTYVNIGANYNTTTEKWESVTEGTSKVTIGGNVFGGGEGEAIKPISNEAVAGAFKCAKAIVTGGTNIHIGNGTINGTVYGGGEVGRVEGNSVVAIGIGAGGTTPASVPEIKGDVFGAGKGKKTHGYSALLRGNPTVTIEGDAKVRGSVYGGGEIASVGKYNVKKGPNNPVGAPDDVLVGMPYSLANSGSGYCTIIIQGNAEIGPETEMKMTGTTSGKPDDTGHVIGGGKGVLPYDGYGVTGDDWSGDPWRVSINDKQDIFNESNATYTTNYEKEYFKYIETLALATETNVTISGNAFVKGSVYGGSLNGHVQHDTHVNIAGGQIGAGENVNRRYTVDEWASLSLAECPHWDYVANSGAPYDPLATTSGTYDYTNYGFVPTAARKTDSDGGLPVAKDGHTYYGNVFGGGSGVIPYAPGLWHRGAGSVGGDTYVNITGGHILSSVYGGNEHTDVGTYTKDASGQPTTTPAEENARGKCTVNMTGGTVGVPRTDDQKRAHPLLGNVFGAGKGDQRIFFNTWTNVINTEVNISGNARIYGSVFGGGEDGHVISNAETNIGNVTTKTGKDEDDNEITKDVENDGLIIGTTGTSYSDGNVFGGGRGFSGEAQTAGTVGGNVRLNINAGSVYGSVYGGGRLASVGTMFEFPTQSNGEPNPAYGQFKEDETGANAKTYGHVTINISGGTIGNPAATGDGVVHSGNVFGGSMGRLTLLNGDTNPIWPKMAQVKETNVNIYGTAVVRRSVYGGGELGTVRDDAYVTIGGQKTADADDDGNVTVDTSNSGSPTVRRDVYGGGYGSEDMNYTIFTIPELKSATADPTKPESYESHTYAFTPMQFAGCVGKNTYVNIAGGYIRKSVYGGGELASVGVINYRAKETTSEPAANQVKIGPIAGKTYYYEHMIKHGDPATGFALSWPYKFNYVDGYPGATHVKVKGGRLGVKGSETDAEKADIGTDNGDVYGAGKGQAGDYKDYLFCANVGSTDVKIAYTSTPTSYDAEGSCIAGAVYGGGEDGHVMGDTKLTISGGLIYHSVYGGGSGKGKFSRELLISGKTYGSNNTSDYETRDAYSITAGKVFGNTEVNMSGGYVVRNIYGGGNMGSVGKGNYAGGSDDYSEAGYGEKVSNLWSNTDFLGSGKCTVKITGGTIGYIDTTTPSNSMYPYNSPASLPYGNVFGGCRGEAVPNITDSPRYYYCPEFFVGYANETIVEIGNADGTGPTILGSVYGGGMDGHIRRDASVTIKGGEIGKTFDATNKGILGNNPDNIQWLARGNVYGAGSGIGKYNDEFCTSAGSVTRFTTVNIQGGTIYRNVYGGGSLASVGAPKIPADRTDNPTKAQTLNIVTISGGNIGDTNSYDANGNHVYGGHVFGGSRGEASLRNSTLSYSTSMFTEVNVNTGANIAGSVFGGGEVGIVKGSVDVTMNGGTVNDDVYGGGALANTNTETSSNVPYTTTVNLLGGLIKGDAYGGGLGQKTDFNSATSDIPAVVYGDISVNLGSSGGSSATAFNVDKYTDTGHAGIVKSGRIFGCNNLMGSPKGDVRVTVYKTVKGNIGRTTDSDEDGVPDKSTPDNPVTPTYEVAAVYGGGNLADYTTVGKKAYVRIETCDVSIRDVYGGGNAAEVPETDVLVRGAYEIQEVFGGGNGKDPYTNGTTWTDNPGANIGNATNPGNATTLLTGGFIHEAYGGSNKKGTIFGSVSIDMGVGSSADNTNGACDLEVEKLVGAGKNADVNGDLIMILGCKPSKKTPLLYAGADDANVKGNVELTITSGNFGKVFGGNNEGGAIFGHIKLNIEETGGCETPITIDELYLGGNMASYSQYGYYNSGTAADPVYEPRTSETDERTAVNNPATDATHTFPYAQPELNVISATYIGQIFGGGYGTGATLYGNPIVNINMIQGSKADGVHTFMANDARLTALSLPSTDNPNNLGVIGDVYGGGNAADVIGNTTVNIGMATTVQCHESIKPDGVTYNMSNAQNVLGAYITGNVFGGGNLAEVSGNTHVNICGTQNPVLDSENKPTGEYTDTSVNHSGTASFAVSIGNSVYGGGNAADVLGNTFVTMADGYVFNGIFGGGLAGSVGTYTRDKSVTVFGHTANHDGCIGKPTACTAGGTCYVVVSGGQIGPVEVATRGEGMNRIKNGHCDPVPQGWVWGGGCGLIEDPSVPANQDTHFKAYVNNTDVTIKDNAFILESIIGGGEFGRVLGNTLVKIKGGQIGVGEGMVVNGKPIRYDDDDFIDPTDTNNPITDSNALAACSHFKFEAPYNTYDPYADSYKAAQGSDKYPGGSTDNASDGKTWIGCVFAGGSGYMPVVKAKDTNNKVTDYEWISSAGWVEGDAEVRISDGHILTNVYGGNEITSVKGKTTVTMTGGTIGVPRTKAQVLANPMTGNLFGAGKGDPRSSFDTFTNVQNVEVNVSGGIIYGSVYGGSEDGHVLGDAVVNISGGSKIGTWGASYIDGNVYGGGMGSTENIVAGIIKGNTTVTIENSTVGGNTVSPTILHNVYGGGAYGSVGTFTYNDDKVITAHTANTGTARVTITGGTIGTNGHENGMVFGSSRGDVGAPGEIHDKLAWVNDTEVKIGTSGQGTTLTTPLIKGSIYGSGENGHTYHDAKVTVHSGTIGITDTSIDGGAAYLYRGNVYGGGCGTDKYDSDNDGVEDSYNPLAGIVYGDAAVTIDGGQVAHNVYGAGAMGSVGKMSDAGAIISGGQTIININGGIIGVDGTAGEGNVFGAARGDVVSTQTHLAQVRSTSVSISDGTVNGNVYGGGEAGDVGTYVKSADGRTYTWDKISDNEIGDCTVEITDGIVKGHVFGAGKGEANTFTCEKAMVRTASVSISGGTVEKNVYGGGEVGRVDQDSQVTIGAETGSEGGTVAPDIKGNVFGAGAGLETHGYSALVRGNTEVTVQGNAKVQKSVYGGGEIAAVGRYGLDESGMPSTLVSGGECKVTVKGFAEIGEQVFGAGMGVDESKKTYTYVSGNTSTMPKRMMTYDPTVYKDNYENPWERIGATNYVWEYYPTRTKYLKFLQTLALATDTKVSIEGKAKVKGSVYGGSESGFVQRDTEVKIQGGEIGTTTTAGNIYGGGKGLSVFAEAGRVGRDVVLSVSGGTTHGSVYGGGEMGYVKGSVAVNMTEGIVDKDVYGGGALADTNTGNWEASTNTWAEGKTSADYTTKVSLLGGTINGDAYGGGLGRKEYGTEGQTGYVSPIEAMVYGDVLVELNNNNNGGDADGSKKGCAVTRVFGCNNLNGTPKGKVQVYVYATQNANKASISTDKTPENLNNGTYDVDAVYGGGNLAPYVPVDATLDYATNKAKVDAARAEVYVDGCALTSIKQVYGGGNAAPVPATYVEINRAYEIDEVFGGGNGYDNYSLEEGNATVWYENPGANVGYYTYASYPEPRQGSGSETDPYKAVENTKFAGGAEHKEARLAAADIQYGSGIATLVVKGGTIHTSYGGSNSKGNVRAKLSSTYSAMFADCAMDVDQSYGGGKNAYSDAEVNQVAACAKGVKEMFGGAKDADIDNDINMLITNGSSLQRVFGGNNTSGAVNGSITITIDESGCEPIQIGELYLGGFLAPYSVYGYKKTNGVYDTEDVEYIDEAGHTQTRAQRIPLKKGDPGALATPHKDPRLYVISATSIGNIFGGGYQAKLVGNPHVNVNMKQGKVEVKKDGDNYKDVNNRIYSATEYTITSPDDEGQIYAILPTGTIGNIYGGGNMADIVGDTYVEIGTGTWHNDDGVLETLGTDGKTYTYDETTKKWSYVDDGGTHTVDVTPTPARNAAMITGNVFGGGKGKADSFECAKAMIGVDGESEDPNNRNGGTNVIIANGTVKGNVYGGGEIGRVEKNTVVTIGLGDGVEGGTKSPVIEGDVFGAGSGKNTHGYSALVRGNSTVTVQGNAWVQKSVYGGGEIASIGKYTVDTATGLPTKPDRGGLCTVTIQGYAEIGPDNMQMKKAGGPDVTGNVFGACKGVLPYEGYADSEKPQHMDGKKVDGKWTDVPKEYKAFNELTLDENKKIVADDAYLTFINTLALASNTEVTIKDHAFVKGSVYGGSQNGHVQSNTHVTIDGDCQIGNGDGVNRRYTAAEWAYDGSSDAKSLKECASWDYGKKIGTDADGKDIMEYLSYDVYKDSDSDGTPDYASDGHTFYGNVFGGGSGYFPYHQNKAAALAALKEKDPGYADGLWHFEAGSVGGNTVVDIIGGHILTSVYGGNEQTDVTGTTTVNMSGGTVGVPRTVDQINNHPLTCYLFGAGKGDQRINFNTWTNVKNTIVNVTGGRIFGSALGGGEDGHVLEDVTMTIGKSGETGPTIGTTGASYFDGNVFGGGRGFGGDAQTAGTVGGNVNLDIESGKILGNVYGGGRLASVGTLFTQPEALNYGNFVEDGDGKTYGHVTINMSGGTVGSDEQSSKYSGNVFGGGMGRLELLDGTINPIWPKMAQVKTSAVIISGDAVIKRSVYGGGELGTVRDDATVTVNGGTIRRNVFGGGYGSQNHDTHTLFTVREPKDGVTNPTNANDYVDNSYAFTPMQFAGCVGKSATVNINGGYVRKNVYGGGEMASVGVINCRTKEVDNSAVTSADVVVSKGTSKSVVYSNMVKHGDENNGFILSWPFEFNYITGYEGATHVNIKGGRLGLKDGDVNDFDDDIDKKDNGDVYGGGKGLAGDYNDFVFCANVGSADVLIEYPAGNTATPTNYTGDFDCIAGAAYAGAENGHVMGDTKLILKNGLVGHAIYGGGSGKGMFDTRLLKIGADPKSTNKNDSITRSIYSITAGKVFGNSTVEMSGGYVVRNVYGGGNMGSVGKGNYAGGADDYSTAGYGEKITGNLWDGKSTNSKAFLNSGKCTVNITGGTVGYIDMNNVSAYMKDGLTYGNVFGGCRGESAPNIGESPRYLYCPEFYVGYANETEVIIGTSGQSSEDAGQPGKAPLIYGSIYGGGQDGHVRRDASVTINSGEIGSAYTGDGTNLNNVEWLHRGNVYGAGSGIGKYKFDFNNDKTYDGKNIEYTNPATGRTSTVNEQDYSTSAGSVTRFTSVTINGGTIHRNVYGGGSLSSVGAPKIPPTREDEPFRRDDSESGKTTQGKQSLNEVTIAGDAIIGDADGFAAGYGGYVFGASRGDATISNPSLFAQAVWTDVDVLGGTIAGDVYGGGEVGSVRQGTEVNLTGGIVANDAYGGGKGTTTVAANVGGETLVKLNEGVGEDEKGSVVGRVFGGNNVNGTPGGKTKVYVYATQNKDKANIKTKYDKHDGIEEGTTTTTYDVKAVYGGGNLSPYIPAGADDRTEVYIQGCDLTSIKQVYGGANSASAPATMVTVNSAYEIQDLFGGGDGQGSESGANVGYKAYPASYDPPASSKEERMEFKYGTGVAALNIYGGRIHRVFGGSNTKGNVRETAITMLDNQNPCPLDIDEVYGGGKSAPMDAEAILQMACIPGLKVAYGGAQEADVLNNVVLNITNGTYDRVFGGNNISGTINGSITVNIEETGCKPLIIGELYGGGNQAGYSVYGYNADRSLKQSGTRLYADPQINVKSFTSIGNIYGGGLGETAVMVGNPTVNIDEVKGDYADYVGDSAEYGENYDYDATGYKGTVKKIDGRDVTLPSHAKGEIGAIQNVFGGGNAAKVVGNTNVNIGTLPSVTLETKEDDTTTTDVDEKHPTVIGADIRGNVYGGGNAAEVTGKTNVVIGEEKKN